MYSILHPNESLGLLLLPFCTLSQLHLSYTECLYVCMSVCLSWGAPFERARNAVQKGPTERIIFFCHLKIIQNKVKLLRPFSRHRVDPEWNPKWTKRVKYNFRIQKGVIDIFCKQSLWKWKWGPGKFEWPRSPGNIRISGKLKKKKEKFIEFQDIQNLFSNSCFSHTKKKNNNSTRLS